MKSLKQRAILLRLARKMRENGNWCGETHLQKAVYLLQELSGVETGFDFVLYKHGPFSFEWRDEITSLRSDELLELQIQPQPYGPKLLPTGHAEKIEKKFPNTLSNNAAQIDFIVGIVGDKGVSDLERLATALYITKHEESGNMAADERAERLHEIKPHIPLAAAKSAVQEIDDFLEQARERGFLAKSE